MEAIGRKLEEVASNMMIHMDKMELLRKIVILRTICYSDCSIRTDIVQHVGLIKAKGAFSRRG